VSKLDGAEADPPRIPLAAYLPFRLMSAPEEGTWAPGGDPMFVAPAPPRTLTKAEQSRLLRTVARAGNQRDSALFSLALGTGLRLRSSWASTWATWRRTLGKWPGRVDLPKNLTKGGRGGVAFLSQRVRSEVRRFLAWKRRQGEPLSPDSPLFLSNQDRRISLRRVQVLFARYQKAAGFEQLYSFHALRHTAITNVYRATRNLFLTQRFARHASPVTTVAYHPSDEELYARIGKL
jgi:integrase/recombinase XerC